MKLEMEYEEWPMGKEESSEQGSPQGVQYPETKSDAEANSKISKKKHAVCFLQFWKAIMMKIIESL